METIATLFLTGYQPPLREKTIDASMAMLIRSGRA